MKEVFVSEETETRRLIAVNLGYYPWAQSLCSLDFWALEHGGEQLRQMMSQIITADNDLYRQVVDFFCELPDKVDEAEHQPTNGLNIAGFVDGLLCTAMRSEVGVGIDYRKLDLARALKKLIDLFGEPSVLISRTQDLERLEPEVAEILVGVGTTPF